jgi:hypothetical protein
MLAHLLEGPPGLDAEGLVDELTGFLTAYVLGGVAATPAPDSTGKRKPASRSARTRGVGRA